MFITCELAVLMLVLTLGGQVQSGGIIGGHDVLPHSRPYMALLEMQMPDNTVSHCGGFLLNEDFVMTAAHCQAKSFRVLLGLHRYYDQEGVQLLSVNQTFPHKDYDPTHVKNDIMLLKLNSKAHFSNHVKPIALAGHDNGHLPKSCIVSGWGQTEDNGQMSPKLMEINVNLSNNNHCHGGKVYCSEEETGPAKGDSGGPLVCEGEKAYGIVSCNKKPHPNGKTIYRYTKIPEYKDWIDNIMKHYGNAKICYT